MMKLALMRKLAFARIAFASSLIAGLVVLAAASPSSSQPLLSIMGLYRSEGSLTLDFHLKDALEKDILASIKNGVPALLSYRVEVWQSRDGWYDKLVRSATYSYRIAYDNWDTVYSVDALTQDKAETGRARSVAELVDMLCVQRGVKACPMTDLNAQGKYYVAMSAAVQALSAERVKEIESWLGGRRDQDPAKAGGLLGFVVDVFTSKAKRAEVKSNVFAIEALEDRSQ